MKKSKLKTLWKIIIVATSIGVTANLGVYIVITVARNNVKKLFKQLQNSETAFSYDTTRSILSPVYFVSAADDVDSLISFYEEISTQKLTPLKFRNQMLPFNNKLYVIDTLANGRVFLIASFDTTCWGCIKGYALSRFFFANPPPAALLNRYYSIIDSVNKVNSRSGKIYNKHNSRNGIQCW